MQLWINILWTFFNSLSLGCEKIQFLFGSSTWQKSCHWTYLIELNKFFFPDRPTFLFVSLIKWLLYLFWSLVYAIFVISETNLLHPVYVSNSIWPKVTGQGLHWQLFVISVHVYINNWGGNERLQYGVLVGSGYIKKESSCWELVWPTQQTLVVLKAQITTINTCHIQCSSPMFSSSPLL